MQMQTNSFTIAHYILMFLVVVLCAGIIGWVMFSDSSPSRDSGAPVDNVIRITRDAQTTNNT